MEHQGCLLANVLGSGRRISAQDQDMHLRLRIRRLNRAMVSAAVKHVAKSKPDMKTKPWQPQLCEMPSNTLRRTVQSNRVEYLAACGEVRRLSEEARRTQWEEFLADLEGNPTRPELGTLSNHSRPAPTPLPPANP